MIIETAVPDIPPQRPIVNKERSSLGLPFANLRQSVSKVPIPTPAGIPYLTRVIKVPFQKALIPNLLQILVAQTKHDEKSSISSLNPAFTRILTVTSSAGHFNKD